MWKMIKDTYKEELTILSKKKNGAFFIAMMDSTSLMIQRVSRVWSTLYAANAMTAALNAKDKIQ